MDVHVLAGSQARLSIDLRQVYEAWKVADRDFRHRFAGSMRWIERNGAEYLMRKTGISERSLGRRGPETERIHDAFMTGRDQARDRLSGLAVELDRHAAMARSIGLGRVPFLTARLLRGLDEADVLGQIRVVGTNALYAYEALAGVHLSGALLATGDVDLLLDARNRLRITAPDGVQGTVLGFLRRLDRSFEVVSGRPYRAVNANGFMVDVICPQGRPPWRPQPGEGKPGGNDVIPSPIGGLQWLMNCPAVEALAIDARGYPAPIVAPTPQVWMAHKMWLSQRPDREPEKRRRDVQQAHAVWDLLAEHLPQYPVDDGFGNTLPTSLQEPFQRLRMDSTPSPSIAEEDWHLPEPKWR